jgi:hypothetical protein
MPHLARLRFGQDAVSVAATVEALLADAASA